MMFQPRTLSAFALNQIDNNRYLPESVPVVEYTLDKIYAEKCKIAFECSTSGRKSIFDNPSEICKTMDILNTVGNAVIMRNLPTQLPQYICDLKNNANEWTEMENYTSAAVEKADDYIGEHIAESNQVISDGTFFKACWSYAAEKWRKFAGNQMYETQRRMLRTLMCETYGIELPDVYKVHYVMAHDRNDVRRICPENGILSSSKVHPCHELYLFYLISAYVNRLYNQFKQHHEFSIDCQCVFCKWNPLHFSTLKPYTVETPVRCDDSNSQFVYMNLFPTYMQHCMKRILNALLVCKDHFTPIDMVLIFSKGLVYKVDKVAYVEDLIVKLKKHTQFDSGILFRIPSYLDVNMEISKLFVLLTGWCAQDVDETTSFTVTYKRYIQNKLLYIVNCKYNNQSYRPYTDALHILEAEDNSDCDEYPLSEEEDNYEEITDDSSDDSDD